MMHKFFEKVYVGILALLVSSVLLASDQVGVGGDESSNAQGRALFSQCAACHLASGEGVKGAFPPIRNRLASMSSNPEGRLYLQSVLLQGLSGKISVSGVDYFGFMQSYGDILNDQQISAVLNYVAVELADEPSVDFKEYSATEVAAARALLKTEAFSSSLRRKNIID